MNGYEFLIHPWHLLFMHMKHFEGNTSQITELEVCCFVKFTKIFPASELSKSCSTMCRKKIGINFLFYTKEKKSSFIFSQNCNWQGNLGQISFHSLNVFPLSYVYKSFYVCNSVGSLFFSRYFFLESSFHQFALLFL